MLYIGNLVSERELEVLPEESISCFLKFWLQLGKTPFWYAVSIALPMACQESPRMKDKGLFLLN